MTRLIARTDRQLGICLRLLYAENVEFLVKVDRTKTGKIVYVVSVIADEAIAADMEKKYAILIS